MYHVMFDVDGTLVNSCGFDDECFISAVADVLGHNIDSNWHQYKHVSDAVILKEHLARIGEAGYDLICHSVKNAFIEKIQEYLLQHPATEVAGASRLIENLKSHDSISLSIATGGWQEAAELKLQSAGINISGIPIASSNDHYARIEIMKRAAKKASVCTKHPITYFGDAEWDQRACRELGYNFVLVGNRIKYEKSVNDLEDIDKILSLIGASV